MTAPTTATDAARTSDARATIPALKEWALVSDLLLRGSMCVLFRKGGIDEKGFWVEANDFYLFPTYFHQNRDKVRDRFVEDFDRAVAAAPPAGVVRLPAFCRVVDAIEVARPDGMAALEDLHPYDESQIAMRLEFRPRKPLVLLAVETYRLPDPLEIPMQDGFGGCSSWVPVDLEAPRSLPAPVLPRAEVEAVAARVRDTVG